MSIDERVKRLREHWTDMGLDDDDAQDAIAIIEELQQELKQAIRDGESISASLTAAEQRIEYLERKVGKLEAALAVAEEALHWYADDYADHYEEAQEALRQIAKLKGSS